MASAMSEAWRRWAADNKPQNEEAFYKCFQDAWAMATTEHLARINRLEDKIRFMDEALNGRMVYKSGA